VISLSMIRGAFRAPPTQRLAKRAALCAALDGSASAIPVTLGGVVLVYAQFPAQYLGYGVFAALCALVLVHLAGAASTRPMVAAARLFEASTLAAMLAQMRQLFPAWGLPAQPQAQAEVLLALLCITGALAGLTCALLYALRAHRFTRLIPAPVYAGFANSIAVLLVLSQAQGLWRLWEQGQSAAALAVVMAAALGVGVVARRWVPRWPASALVLAAGAAVGLAQWAAGLHTPMLAQPGAAWVLPWQVADFSALWAAGVHTRALAQTVLASGALLGVMLFINMTVANETLTQIDNRRASVRQHMLVALACGVGAAWGAVPIAPSQQASLAAARSRGLSPQVPLGVALVVLLVAASGVLGWVALAAVAAATLCDAYYLADRPSLQLARQRLLGLRLSAHQMEDLALVMVVTVAAVAVNAVAAVLVGFVLGLMLFALRNAQKPVRHVRTGAQQQSNCARNRYELAQLALDGHRIKVLELERELFFGAVGSLEQSLKESLQEAHAVVLDWSQVRHVDSSVALALVRFEAQAAQANVNTWHAGAHLQPGNCAALLAQYLPHTQQMPDLDHALEAAENHVIALRAAQQQATTGALPPELAWGDAATHFFDGLSEAQRDVTQRLMRYRRFNKGDVIFREGEESYSLLLVLQGSVQVMKAAPLANHPLHHSRLSTVASGGTVGEIGLLDGAPRSATVTAQEEVLVQELTREAYELLRKLDPDIVQHLVKNVALDLGTRLRQATMQVASKISG
jgi:sulfate permease, SulP family